MDTIKIEVAPAKEAETKEVSEKNIVRRNTTYDDIDRIAYCDVAIMEEGERGGEKEIKYVTIRSRLLLWKEDEYSKVDASKWDEEADKRMIELVKV